MNRLDEIMRKIDGRMEEIERKINGITGECPASSIPEEIVGRGGSFRSAQGGKNRGLVAPFSPAFTAWVGERSSGVEGSFGLVPQPFDYSFLARLPGPGWRGRTRNAFPVRFDLREKGALPPVRDQGGFGTCWAHAALASLESCLMKRGGHAPDFSENNMANLSGFDGGFGDGGTADMAGAYLLRWDGPVLERDDPYGRPGASRGYPPAFHLQSTRLIPQMRDATDTAGIKESLMQLGAVWVGYNHSWNAYRKDTAAYYDARGKGDGGHAVALVGWDDAYPAGNFGTVPPGDGAWIVRNSWGKEFGEDGYFHVSYHDATFGRWGMPMYVFDGAEDAGNYDDVFQYDRLGLVSAVGNGGPEAAAANVFTVPRDLSVEAVGLYLLAPGTSYRIAIHAGVGAENPAEGTEMGVTEGRDEWAGYRTIRLSSPVRVAAGCRFSVVAELESPGTQYPAGVEMAFPRGGSSKAEAGPGQSFLAIPGKGWVDMLNIDKTMNFCCKAYVKFADGLERSFKRFCSKCGKYSYTEHSTGGKCSYCGAWF